MQLLITLAAFILTLICLCAAPYYFNRNMKIVALLYFVLTIMNIMTLIGSLR